MVVAPTTVSMSSSRLSNWQAARIADESESVATRVSGIGIDAPLSHVLSSATTAFGEQAWPLREIIYGVPGVDGISATASQKATMPASTLIHVMSATAA